MIVDLETARAQRGVQMIEARLPAGLDYQGRYQPRPFVDTMPAPQPQPAEACTELGADDEGCALPGARLGALIVITTGVPFLLALVSWALSLLPAGIGQP